MAKSGRIYREETHVLKGIPAYLLDAELLNPKENRLHHRRHLTRSHGKNFPIGNILKLYMGNTLWDHTRSNSIIFY